MLPCGCVLVCFLGTPREVPFFCAVLCDVFRLHFWRMPRKDEPGHVVPLLEGWPGAQSITKRTL